MDEERGFASGPDLQVTDMSFCSPLIRSKAFDEYILFFFFVDFADDFDLSNGQTDDDQNAGSFLSFARHTRNVAVGKGRALLL